MRNDRASDKVVQPQPVHELTRPLVKNALKGIDHPAIAAKLSDTAREQGASRHSDVRNQGRGHAQQPVAIKVDGACTALELQSLPACGLLRWYSHLQREDAGRSRHCR